VVAWDGDFSAISRKLIATTLIPQCPLVFQIGFLVP